MLIGGMLPNIAPNRHIRPRCFVVVGFDSKNRNRLFVSQRLGSRDSSGRPDDTDALSMHLCRVSSVWNRRAEGTRDSPSGAVEGKPVKQ